MLNWRPMREEDLSDVMILAEIVHQELHECEAVFAERLELFPGGCLVLQSDKLLSSDNRIEGYVFSHPILRCQPPTLNTMLFEVPGDADSYYIHDLVVAPPCRGGGHATTGVTRILNLANGFKTTTLIAVHGTLNFWTRFGFVPAKEGLTSKLVSYGKDAIYMVRNNSMVQSNSHPTEF